MDRFPKVGIIVLNYNGKQDTLDCLKSLSRIDYPNYELIVVDNASTDGSVEAIKTQYPTVKLVQSKVNLGTAGGDNLGFRYCFNRDFKWFFLLNNDTLVEPNFLKVLMIAQENRPGYTLYATQIRIADKKDTIWYAGGRLFFFFGMVWMLSRNSRASKNQDFRLKEVSFTPTAFLGNCEKIKKVGVKKEGFFIYWDDADWEARLMKAGCKFLYVPEAIIYHKVSQSSGGEDNPKIQYYHYRNAFLFAKYNLSWYHWLVFLPIMIIRILLIEPLLGLVWLLRGYPRRIQGIPYIFKGIYDFLGDKLGKM